MKTKVVVLTILIMMVLGAFTCFAKELPESYMEISASNDWAIFTKDMDDKALLSSFDKTKEEINEAFSCGATAISTGKQDFWEISDE